MLITSKLKVLDRWEEHFIQYLNRPSAINEEEIAFMPLIETETALVKMTNDLLL